jgi:hypothetical protein
MEAIKFVVPFYNLEQRILVKQKLTVKLSIPLASIQATLTRFSVIPSTLYPYYYPPYNSINPVIHCVLVTVYYSQE